MQGVLTTVNDRGHRGVGHPYAPTQGRTRVVMLGDSVAFGVGVTDGETFSALLESRSGGIEVINLAVEGYGTDQELLRLEGEGLRYHPRVVVLTFCVANDLVNNAGEIPKPYFTLEGETLRLHAAHMRLSPPRAAAQGLEDESHLYHRLLALFPERPRPEGRAEPDAPREGRLGPRAAAELTFALIRRVAFVTKGAGARLLVLLHPDEPAFAQRSSVLRRFCKTESLEGIAVVDLAERYRALGLEFGQIARDQQGHLTPLGHHFAAEVIESLLAEPPSIDHRLACRDEPHGRDADAADP